MHFGAVTTLLATMAFFKEASKICQILIHDLSKIAVEFQNFAQVAQFRQIWSLLHRIEDQYNNS